MTVVDVNCDVGESFGRWVLGDDAAVLPFVTSANVACGFHAGDPTTLRRTCELAAKENVVVGAQVGYRDLAGFGRRFIDVAADELTADIIYQIGALQALAAVAGTTVKYVKPHGALHNATVEHELQAAAVVDAVRLVDPDLPILGLPGSALLDIATYRGLRAVPEAFADRAYTPAGILAPRSAAGAVLSDPTVVADRAVQMIVEGTVVASDGSVVPVRAESICVHGDSPGAVEMAAAVTRGLERAGVEIRAFA